MKVIIPAAGKGTRMAEIADGRSKEMLALGAGSVLDYILAEARSVTDADVQIVTSESKSDVIIFAQRRGAAILYQHVQNGLAPAVAMAIEPAQPILVILPDTVFYPNSPSVKLINAIKDGCDIAISVELVEDDKVSQYGIVELNPDSWAISRILEKPKPEETISRWAVSARYAFSERASHFLKQWIDRHSPSAGELSITPAIQAALDSGLSSVAIPLETDMVRYDCGSPEGYQRALKVIQ